MSLRLVSTSHFSSFVTFTEWSFPCNVVIALSICALGIFIVSNTAFYVDSYHWVVPPRWWSLTSLVATYYSHCHRRPTNVRNLIIAFHCWQNSPSIGQCRPNILACICIYVSCCLNMNFDIRAVYYLWANSIMFLVGQQLPSLIRFTSLASNEFTTSSALPVIHLAALV